MLFNFQLRSLGQVLPWQSQGQSYLHWFGLTDGWYWLHLGEVELFRYTDAIMAVWRETTDDVAVLPYVDYQVVRLWEDIQEILPHILEPIPDAVLQKIEPGGQGWLWRQRLAHTLFSDDVATTDSIVDTFDMAFTWMDERRLGVGYLRSGPNIWLWTNGDTLFISWFNDDCFIDDIPVWTATSGKVAIPLQAFLDEVRSFDRRLLGEMNERVNSIRLQWNRPEVKIDLKRLTQEQTDRSTWMEQAFEESRQRPPTSWRDVLSAIENLERDFVLPVGDPIIKSPNASGG